MDERKKMKIYMAAGGLFILAGILGLLAGPTSTVSTFALYVEILVGTVMLIHGCLRLRKPRPLV